MAAALIVVDLQNDFSEEGVLAVPNVSEIIETVNQLLKVRRLCWFKSSWSQFQIIENRSWKIKGENFFGKNRVNGN